MSQLDPSIHAKLQRHRMMSWIIAGLLIVAIWIYFFVKTAGHSTDSYFGNVQFIFAILITVGAPIGAWVNSGQLTTLMNRGVETHARLEKMGIVAKNRMRPATFSYEVDGKSYSRRIDVDVSTLAGLSEGSVVTVVYDSKNPKVCKIFPDIERAESA